MKTKKKKNKKTPFFFIIFILLAIFIISNDTLPVKRFLFAATTGHNQTQQQGTFELITPTPTITPIPQPSVAWGVTPYQTVPGSPVAAGPLPTGGAASPSDPFYCIDDEDPEGCDDATAFLVPKGVGGPAGQCGTIMENAHKIVASLPQDVSAFRDSVNPAVSNACYNTGTYSGGYLSTFFVIDAYNLAGFHELSIKNGSHVSGTGMLNWWKSQPPGYTFVPYNTSVLQQHASGQNDLTGCVMFINLPSGKVHVGIVNVLQLVNGNGDGVLSIVQAGARYYIDRFPVGSWTVKNTPLHQTQLQGVAGFGCHT